MVIKFKELIFLNVVMLCILEFKYINISMFFDYFNVYGEVQYLIYSEYNYERYCDDIDFFLILKYF